MQKVLFLERIWFNVKKVRKNWATVPLTLWLSSGVGSRSRKTKHEACLVLPGALEWTCCRPEGVECFITEYTKDQLSTTQSLASGQQCRWCRRGAILPPHLLPHSLSHLSCWSSLALSAPNSREQKAPLLSCLFDESRVSDNGLELRPTKTAELHRFVIIDFNRIILCNYSITVLFWILFRISK